MDMTIFFIVNGVGAVFLLYVLANFWKEGHRPTSEPQEHTMERLPKDRVSVLVVTHPISHSANGGMSVISFQAQRSVTGKQNNRDLAASKNGTPVKTESLSTR